MNETVTWPRHFHVRIQRCEDPAEGTYFVGNSVEWPGFTSQEKTAEEAEADQRRAIQEFYRSEGQPEPTVEVEHLPPPGAPAPGGA